MLQPNTVLQSRSLGDDNIPLYRIATMQGHDNMCWVLLQGIGIIYCEQGQEPRIVVSDEDIFTFRVSFIIDEVDQDGEPTKERWYLTTISIKNDQARDDVEYNTDLNVTTDTRDMLDISVYTVPRPDDIEQKYKKQYNYRASKYDIMKGYIDINGSTIQNATTGALGFSSTTITKYWNRLNQSMTLRPQAKALDDNGKWIGDAIRFIIPYPKGEDDGGTKIRDAENIERTVYVPALHITLLIHAGADETDAKERCLTPTIIAFPINDANCKEQHVINSIRDTQYALINCGDKMNIFTGLLNNTFTRLVMRYASNTDIADSDSIYHSLYMSHFTVKDDTRDDANDYTFMWFMGDSDENRNKVYLAYVNGTNMTLFDTLNSDNKSVDSAGINTNLTSSDHINSYGFFTRTTLGCTFSLSKDGKTETVKMNHLIITRRNSYTYETTIDFNVSDKSLYSVEITNSERLEDFDELIMFESSSTLSADKYLLIDDTNRYIYTYTGADNNDSLVKTPIYNPTNCTMICLRNDTCITTHGIAKIDINS